MRDTGPARTVVTSDTGEAAPNEYVTYARTLLGQLKGRMTAGGLAQLSRSVILPDGTTIAVASIHGQDSMRIDRPNAPPQVFGSPQPAPPEIVEPPPEPLPPRPTQDICTPGPDGAVFSEPLACYNTVYSPAVMSPQRDVVFVTGASPGLIAWFNNSVAPDAVTNASQLYRLDPTTLALLGQELIDYPNDDGTRVRAAADKSRSGFLDSSGMIRIPVLHLPDESDFAPSTSAWDKTGTPSEIETPSTNYASEVVSAGTTYGAVLAIRSLTPDGGPNSETTVTLDPVTGAITGSLSWPTNADLTSGTILWACAQANANFLLALNNDVYLIDPTGNKLKTFGAPPDDTITGCMHAGAAWVQTTSGLYQSTGGGWKQMLAWPATTALLAYDHFTDAVVMVKPDGSSATIFGGVDCQQQPMGVNTVKLKPPPTSYTQLTVSQCEFGSLLVTFGTGIYAEPLGSAPDTPATVIVARYALGILRQVRTTLYE